jgi:hypothetical protein
METYKSYLVVTNNRLELDIRAVGSAALNEEILPFTENGKFVIDAITQNTDTGTEVTIVGTGGNLPFMGMRVTAVFAMHGEEPALTITAVGDDRWTLAHGFPAMQNTFLEQMRYEAPTLVLRSHPASEEEVAGMTFAGALDMDSPFGVLELFFPQGRHDLSGPIVMAPRLEDIAEDIVPLPSIYLTGSEGGSADLGVFHLNDASFEINVHAYFDEYWVQWNRRALFSLSATVPFEAQGTTHHIPLYASVGDPDAPILLTADMREVGSVGLHELETLVQNAGLNVPFDFEIGNLVEFTGLKVAIDPKGSPLVRHVAMEVQTPETVSWTIVQDLLELQAIDLHFRVDTPFGAPKLTGSLAALLGIGEHGTLETTIFFDQRALGASLREGDGPLNIREVYEHFTKTTNDHLPDLVVDKFVLFAQLPSETQALNYSGEIELTGEWVLLEDEPKMSLLEVAFDLEHPDADTTRFSALAQFAIEGVVIGLRAEYRGATEGWFFSGSTGPDQEIPIGNLVKTLAERFDQLHLPKPIADLTIENLWLEVSTGQKAFVFRGEARFPIESTLVDIKVSIDTALQLFGGEISVQVPVGDTTSTLIFDLFFFDDTTSTLFLATYSHKEGDPVPKVKDVVNAFSPEAAAYVPAGLAVDIRDVIFVFDKTPVGAVYLFAVDINVEFDLTNLPLVGKLLPPEERVGVKPLQIVATQGGSFTQENILVANGLMPAGVNHLPANALETGLAFNLVLELGGLQRPLALPAVDRGATPNAPATRPATTKDTAVTGDNALWFKVQRAFGPVHFERIGLQYRHPEGKGASIAFLLDGSLTAVGLTLGLQGLSIGFDLEDLRAIPVFDLQGLDLDYSSGQVEIGGSFLASKLTYPPAGKPGSKEYTAYSGRALIKTETFTLGAIGSYMLLDEGPSLFVYGFLDYPLGGPPFFFVRGLAAGFGYNRRLITPSIEGVADFPLVTEVTGQRKPGTLSDELRQLQDYLPPSVGDYFLAIGIRFTSFNMIDSFVLLAVGFGHRFELNVLGLSTMILPSPDVDSTGATPLAELQLALRATFAPDDGFFGINAQLTQNSYLLSRDCHLTGGFAFYSWFGEQHHGDFVLTVGGYHPRFSRPEHYPVVPRLGFNWQVDSNLMLKGSAYYALMPSMLMAGGGLSATWEDGNLKAWFDASMDFLIAWKPYHYEADFHISLGASYTFWFFGTQHITVHIGADVSIWGPEFSGKVYIDLSILSFTVRFGPQQSPSITPIDWPQFRQSFLPEDSKVCTVAVRDGLVQHAEPDGTADGGSDGMVTINPRELVLATDSVVPSKTALRGEADHETALPTDGATLGFGIGPMNKKDGDLRTTQRVVITHDDKPADDHFEYRPLTKNLPFALWGGELSPSMSNPQMVNDMLTGYEIRPKAPLEPGDAPGIPRSALQSATPLFTEDDSFGWLSPAPFVPEAPDDDGERRRLIEQTIDSEQVRASRANIAGALFADGVLDLDGFDADEFLAAPQVGTIRLHA